MNLTSAFDFLHFNLTNLSKCFLMRRFHSLFLFDTFLKRLKIFMSQSWVLRQFDPPLAAFCAECCFHLQHQTCSQSSIFGRFCVANEIRSAVSEMPRFRWMQAPWFRLLFAPLLDLMKCRGGSALAPTSRFWCSESPACSTSPSPGPRSCSREVASGVWALVVISSVAWTFPAWKGEVTALSLLTPAPSDTASSAHPEWRTRQPSTLAHPR